MFSFLKFIIFALGLATAYILLEHYIFNAGTEQSLSETINQTENAISSKVRDIGDNIDENYIRPAEEKAENIE